MPITIEITQEHKDKVAEMAANGMTAEMICKAIGISRATFYRKPELVKIFQAKLTESLNKIGRAMINGALAGDVQLITFALKMRGGFKEFAPPHLSEDFATKTHFEKQQEIDELWKSGEITTDNYTNLCDSLTKQYQLVEHEARLKAIEEALKNKDNASTYQIIVKDPDDESEEETKVEDIKDGETNNSTTQENTSEPIRPTEQS